MKRWDHEISETKTFTVILDVIDLTRNNNGLVVPRGGGRGSIVTVEAVEYLRE